LADGLLSKVYAIPDANRGRALVWIRRKLPYNPLPRSKAVRGSRAHGVVDPLRSRQDKNRKAQHVRLGGLWRLNYVVLRRWRIVFVFDCAEHNSNYLYSPAYMREMFAAARALRKNPPRSA
jgi:hypothetical protein